MRVAFLIVLASIVGAAYIAAFVGVVVKVWKELRKPWKQSEDAPELSISELEHLEKEARRKPFKWLAAFLLLAFIFAGSARAEKFDIAHEAAVQLKETRHTLHHYERAHRNDPAGSPSQLYITLNHIDCYLLNLEIHRYRRGNSSPLLLLHVKNQLARDMENAPEFPVLKEAKR